MATHLQIDFETLGNQPDTAVLSLGAVIFDKTGIKHERLWLFDLMGQLEVGRRSVSSDTIIWWMGQSGAKQIFEKLVLEGILLKDFVPQFMEFVKQAGPDVRVWANDTGFDTSIAENILQRMGQKPPWKFWNRRCYRTMKACFQIDKPFQGTKHDALDDSRHQAKCLIEFWQQNPKAEN